MPRSSDKENIVIGWREWISLPELGVEKIKVKVDTGARTSALHAFGLKSFKEDGKHRVVFQIHPYQRRDDIVINCIADVTDVRWVTDSGGHRERRYVIDTPIKLGNHSWPIEITLTNRDPMNFRMLLGRTSMKNKVIVNPSSSYLIKNTQSDNE